jgi:hypothetical protein
MSADPPTPQPPGGGLRSGERWVALLLALASFNLTAWLVGLAVPHDTRGDIGGARRRFLEQIDEIDAVFIGSSRLQQGVDVEELERCLRESGEELRAFNFGAGGMRTLEQGPVLSWVLDQRPPGLEWVVLEAWPLGITLRKNTDYSRKAEEMNARVISWHTTSATRHALAAIRRLPLPIAERWRMARHHLDAWARHVWNLGLLSERLFDSSRALSLREQQAAGSAPVAELSEAEETPGFGSVLGTDPRKQPLRKAREQGREQMSDLTDEEHRRRVDQVRQQNEMPVDLARLDLGLLEERKRAARAAGVRLIYMTMPGESGSPEVLRLHEAGLLGTLLHFNDPDRYPELFAKELRETPAHLNRDGARVFSRLLAEELLRLRAP